MQYAIVNGIKSKATSGAIGKCPFCNSTVRAYCGELLNHHWKHSVKKDCDQWFETETQWHIDWKNQFKNLQKEYIFIDPLTKEKHIADVFNQYLNLVIEFQHSSISLGEMKAREKYYKKMIWVVDISPHFEKIILYDNSFENFDEYILHKWSKSYNKNSDYFIKNDHENLLEYKSEREYLDALSDKYFEKEVMEGFEDFPTELGSPPVYAIKLNDGTKIMEWQYQHKVWNFSNLPTFFDLGNNKLYLCKETIPMLNIFIVKPYSKNKFIEYYSREI